MSGQHEFLIEPGNGWMNYYSPEPPDETRNPERERSSTLHMWQNEDVTVPCVALISRSPADTPTVIPKSDAFKLDFSIQGGSQFPRFMVRLTLKNKSHPVHMTAYFPAFSERDFRNAKAGQKVQPHDQLRLPTNDNSLQFHFSESLQNVKFQRKALKESLPKSMLAQLGLSGDGLHRQIEWISYRAPICINFGANTDHLTNEQKSVASSFREINNSSRFVRIYVITVVNRLLSKIAYLINMPETTPQPYPYYHTAYDQNTKQLLRLKIQNIEPLFSHHNGRQTFSDAALHFMSRKKGWQSMRPTEIVQQSVTRINRSTGYQRPELNSLPLKGKGSQNQNQSLQRSSGQGYYLNEREYEVVQLVGLARDLQFATEFTANLFNRYYDFDMVPAGLTTREAGAVINEFYIFLNVRPIKGFGDDAAVPPAPGVRVKITIPFMNIRTSSSRAQEKPRMAIDTSGLRNSIVKYRRDALPMSGTDAVRPISRKRATSGASVRSSQGDVSDEGGSGKDKTWYGVVIPRSGPIDDEFEIVIYISIEDTGLGMGLQGCYGHFNFGSVAPPSQQAEQAVHLAMYGEQNYHRIYSNNWLKSLLLSHDNEAIGRHPQAGPHSNPQIMQNVTFNNRQRAAFDRAISGNSTSINSRVTIIRAPAGTGKTFLATSIAYHSYRRNERLLMSAASNYAVDTMADSVYKALLPVRPTTQKWKDYLNRTQSSNIEFQAAQGIWGVYRLEKEADEHYSNFVRSTEVADRNTLTILSDSDEFRPDHIPLDQVNLDSVDETEYRAIETYVKYRSTTGRRLSLGDHILARLEKARHEKSAWVNDWKFAEEEFQKLWWFITLRVQLSKLGYHFADIVGTTDGERNQLGMEMSAAAAQLSTQSVAAWRDLQKHYLCNATIVLVTAATAGRKSMRAFRAQRVLVDEAAQITEIETLNAVVRSFSRLQKMILIGDPAQLQPVVISRNANEYFDERSRSLMVRLEATGIPHMSLTEQRRMDPQISRFANTHFYGGTLTDHLTVRDRPEAAVFRQMVPKWASHVWNITAGQSTIYFFNHPNSLVRHRKSATSLINTGFLGVLVATFLDLYPRIKSELKKHPSYRGEPTFAIMGYYAEEIVLLRRWIYQIRGFNESSVSIINVDASQGKEYDYVFLSTCRTGGASGLGFVSNVHRLNVAVTRARNGLIIVGDRNIGQVPKMRDDIRQTYEGQKRGHQAWVSLVKYCNSLKALVTIPNKRLAVEAELGLNLEEWVVLGEADSFVTP